MLRRLVIVAACTMLAVMPVSVYAAEEVAEEATETLVEVPVEEAPAEEEPIAANAPEISDITHEIQPVEEITEDVTIPSETEDIEAKDEEEEGTPSSSDDESEGIQEVLSVPVDDDPDDFFEEDAEDEDEEVSIFETVLDYVKASGIRSGEINIRHFNIKAKDVEELGCWLALIEDEELEISFFIDGNYIYSVYIGEYEPEEGEDDSDEETVRSDQRSESANDDVLTDEDVISTEETFVADEEVIPSEETLVAAENSTPIVNVSEKPVEGEGAVPLDFKDMVLTMALGLAGLTKLLSMLM